MMMNYYHPDLTLTHSARNQSHRGEAQHEVILLLRKFVTEGREPPRSKAAHELRAARYKQPVSQPSGVAAGGTRLERGISVRSEESGPLLHLGPHLQRSPSLHHTHASDQFILQQMQSDRKVDAKGLRLEPADGDCLKRCSA